MVSVILIWAQAMTMIVVSMMTLTLTPMSGRISLYMMLSYCNMLMLLVHALPLMGIVPTVRLLLKAFALMNLSLTLMGDLLLVPAHLPVVIPTLTWMITVVTQVTSMTTARRSNSGYNVCIPTTQEEKKKRRKGNVNLWFNTVPSYLSTPTFACSYYLKHIFLAVVTVTLLSCDVSIPWYVNSIKMVMQSYLSASHLVN
jgi:hypothetical protein